MNYLRDFRHGDGSAASYGAPGLRAPAGRSDNSGQRIGVSVVLAFVLGGAAVVLFKRFGDVKAPIGIVGLIMGFVMLVPLRYGTAAWRSSWCWRAIPAGVVFAGLTVAGCGTEGLTGRDWFTRPIPQAIVFSWAVLLGGTLVKPFGTVTESAPAEYKPSRPAREPQWPPDTWTQQEWDDWWAELCEWVVYRVEELGEQVEPLLQPPPLPVSGVLSADNKRRWEVWWQAYRAWDAPTLRDEWDYPPEAVSDFPVGWSPPEDESGSRCSICGRSSGALAARGVRIGKCPWCERLVCRECLHKSRDECTTCGYVSSGR